MCPSVVRVQLKYAFLLFTCICWFKVIRIYRKQSFVIQIELEIEYKKVWIKKSIDANHLSYRCNLNGNLVSLKKNSSLSC